MKRWLFAIWLACGCLGLTAFSGAQVKFQLIPNPTGPTYSNYALSGNGTVMAANYGGELFRWTSAGGFVDLGPGDPFNSSIGISRDGSTIISGRVGPDGNTNSAIWQQATGWVDLGHPAEGCVLDSSWGSGWGLNKDGTIAVGLAWYCPGAEGFRWTQQTGMVGLGHPTNASSRASAISGDGSMIVGFYEDPTQGFRRPVRWVGGNTDLFTGDQTIGEADAVSSDGSQIVGQSTTSTGSIQAFYYTDKGGLVSLGTLTGHKNDGSGGNAVSDNGLVVGYSGNLINFDLRAFVWSPQGGMRYLRQALESHGAVIPSNVILNNAIAISADGSTIVGTWQDVNFNGGGWIARIKKGTSLF